ncbi:MAG: hypothetical protein HY299_02935 [Verrucomicrobia bacterium]|nr:hypothetical protein [Verrucomicrobiota bacterium]
MPNGYNTNSSKEHSNLPFNYYGTNMVAVRGDSRYQQIYDASQFSSLPPGGALLSYIEFRSGCGSRNAVIFSNNAAIFLTISTTQKAVDGLSPRFADNLGPDQITVFSNELFLVLGDNGPCDSRPKATDWRAHLFLQAPFFYDPHKGNLLLDMRIPKGTLTRQNFLVDLMDTEIVSTFGDSMSRMVGAGLNATNAETIDSAGLVTQFHFVPYPPVIRATYFSASQPEPGLGLDWFVQPKSAKLQLTTQSPPTSGWVDYQGVIGDDGIRRGIFIPLADLKKQQFFRLFIPPGQPGLPSLQSDEALSVPDGDTQ